MLHKERNANALCDTNVYKGSEQSLNTAPYEFECVEQETAATGDPDQGERRKNNEVDFDIPSSNDE